MTNFFIAVNNFLNTVLFYLRLRQIQKYWGIVYDSQTKQPIDPAVVKLIDVKSGKVAATSITNIKGRYGFLAAPGKYKILVKKTNYAFPSKLVSGDTDKNYAHVYHGELFELFGGSEVVPFNIPMDPQAFDWNQSAKIKMAETSPLWDFFANFFVKSLFWFLLLLTAVNFYFKLSLTAKKILFFLLGCFLFVELLPQINLWGKLKNKKTGEPLEGGLLELSYVQAEDIVVARAKSMSDGKFFLYAEPGQYLLKIKKFEITGEAKVVKVKKISIGKAGVYNYLISC